MTSGNVYDGSCAINILNGIDLEGSNLLADKAYNSSEIREFIESQGGSYTIPPKTNTKDKWPVDWIVYKERHLVECFFCKIKQFRRIATRYEKLAESFLGFVYLAGIFILLNCSINCNNSAHPETRQVVSHKVGEHMTKELATSVINPDTLAVLGTTIIHSDMGSQYTSDLFEETLKKHKIKHSYSKKGCPGDNARIESFHSILKREYIHFQNFKSLEEAIVGIDTYIRWYNHGRISLVA